MLNVPLLFHITHIIFMDILFNYLHIERTVLDVVFLSITVVVSPYGDYYLNLAKLALLINSNTDRSLSGTSNNLSKFPVYNVTTEMGIQPAWVYVTPCVFHFTLLSYMFRLTFLHIL